MEIQVAIRLWCSTNTRQCSGYSQTAAAPRKKDSGVKITEKREKVGFCASRRINFETKVCVLFFSMWYNDSVKKKKHLIRRGKKNVHCTVLVSPPTRERHTHTQSVGI